MKKYLLLICLMVLPVVAGYNPNWISIKTVEQTVANEPVYQEILAVCKGSGKQIKIEFQFQDDPGDITQIEWKFTSEDGLSKIDGNSVANEPYGSGTYTVFLNVAQDPNNNPQNSLILPTGNYIASAIFGDETIKVEWEKRFSIITVDIAEVDFVQTDIHRNFELKVEPRYANAIIDLNISQTTFGTAGAAEFQGGGTTKALQIGSHNKLHNVYIKGTTASITAIADKQNVKLSAKVNGFECGSEQFEVKDCTAVFDEQNVVKFDVTGPDASGLLPLQIAATVSGATVEGLPGINLLTKVADAIPPSPPRGGVTWKKDVKITVFNGTNKADYEVGFVQTVLTNEVKADYDNGWSHIWHLDTPMNDGDPALWFRLQTAPIKSWDTFANSGNDNILKLDFHDVPGTGDYLFWSDIPNSPAIVPEGKIIKLTYIVTFRTWIVVKHKDGCLKALKHMDWNVNYVADIAYPGNVITPTINTATCTVTTQMDGDGSPSFIESNNHANTSTWETFNSTLNGGL